MPSFPQYELKQPLHGLFTQYIENNKKSLENVVFAHNCIRDGISYIISNSDFFRAAPLMEKQFKGNATGQVYYQPDASYNIEDIQKTLLNTKNITSKRMLIREASIWFLEEKQLIKVTHESIQIAGGAPRLVRSE